MLKKIIAIALVSCLLFTLNAYAEDDQQAGDADKLAEYMKQSDKFWELLKQRKYPLAETALNDLATFPGIKDDPGLAEAYKYDEQAFKLTQEFWKVVESNISSGALLFGGKVVSKSGGKVGIKTADSVQSRDILELTLRQAEGLAGLKKHQDHALMVAILTLAEVDDVKAKVAAVEKAGEKAEYYKKKLSEKIEPKPQPKSEPVLTVDEYVKKSLTDLVNENYISKIPKELLPAEDKNWDDFSFAKVDTYFNPSLKGQTVTMACKITSVKWAFDDKSKQFKVAFGLAPQGTNIKLFGIKFSFSHINSSPQTSIVVTEEEARAWDAAKKDLAALPQYIVKGKLKSSTRQKRSWTFELENVQVMTPSGEAPKPPVKSK